MEDKWAEWDAKQSSCVPTNIVKGRETTHVADNIDWKNKSISGKETHHTNSISIQHSKDDDIHISSTGVQLQSDYNFERSEHRSYKCNEKEKLNVITLMCRRQTSTM